MPKEPLYPHVPKSRQPLFPHVPGCRQLGKKLPQVFNAFALGQELAQYVPHFKVEAFEIPVTKFVIPLGEIDDKRKLIHLNLWPGATKNDALAVLAHEYAHIAPGTTVIERGVGEVNIWQRGEGYAQKWGVRDEYRKLGRELAEYYESRKIHPHIVKGIREWLGLKQPLLQTKQTRTVYYAQAWVGETLEMSTPVYEVTRLTLEEARKDMERWKQRRDVLSIELYKGKQKLIESEEGNYWQLAEYEEWEFIDSWQRPGLIRR